MRTPMLRRSVLASFSLVASLLVWAPSLSGQAPADEALVKKARAIHDKVIALDTHDDIDPANFTAERNYTQRLDTQVNLPKMVEGGLDAAFFIVYVGQTTEAQAADAFDAGRLRPRLRRRRSRSSTPSTG